MFDARSNTPMFGFVRPLKANAVYSASRSFFIISLALVFLLNAIGGDVLTGGAWAAEPPSGLTSVGPDSAGGPSPLKSLSAATFTLPMELGYVQESAEIPNSVRTVIHIQDAHCNYAAQKSIAELLNYLSTEYGISAVNCEGGAESYDLSPFTVIPEKDVREKTADFFVKEGVVSAAEYYAVNNPEKVSLWGVEDPDLYLKNLKVYRDSLAYKNEVDRYIKEIGYILDNLKRHIYSEELQEFDRYYAGYKDGKTTFKEYMLYLIGSARKRMIDIKSFSNMYLLSQTLADEDNINFKRANNEKDEVVDKLKKTLSRNELEELMSMVGKLKAERISQSDFYTYLVKKAKSVKLDISVYPELQKYIIYISLYSAIDRAKVTGEISALEDRIKASLYENDTQRELGILSKDLSIMKNIFNVSLTKDDYIYYRQHRESFAMANYVSFIDKKAPLYKIGATLDKNIGVLDVYREKMDLFYECSLERDKAFIKNIKFTDHDRPSSIIITGGFHTENLRELFKNENVSYVSIMPKFSVEKGYESPYMKRLAGQSTALENVMNTAIPAVLNLAIVNILCKQLALEVDGPAKIKQFRLAVAIMAATMRDKPFVLKLNKGLVINDKELEEEKFVTFLRPEGADIPKTLEPTTTEPAKVDAELTAFGPTVFEWAPVTPKGQKQFAATETAVPGKEQPAELGGSLIGKLLDRNGNVITGGFRYDISPDGKTVGITHSDMEGSVTVEVSSVIVQKDKIALAIRKLLDSDVAKALSQVERKEISSVLDKIEGAIEIVAIKPKDTVKGFYYEKGERRILFLSEDIVNHPLGLIHEMGEGSNDIMDNILEKAKLSNVNVPGPESNITYSQALNAHTLWRGVGKDLRVAFNSLVADKMAELKGKGISKEEQEEKAEEVMSAMSVEGLVKALEARMEYMADAGLISKARVAQKVKEGGLITRSERALIHYNAEQEVDGEKRAGRELLFGLQDRLDPELNAAFTQGIRIITNDLRQNMMNIFVLHANEEARAAQTAVARQASTKFEKKYGISTGVFYFNGIPELKIKIEKALEEAARSANASNYPKIFVDCLSQEELDAVNGIIDRIKEEIGEGDARFKGLEVDKLDNMIAVAKDFDESAAKTGLSIPDEVRVIAIGSAIMNDKRLSVDFGMSAADLFEARKKTLEFLAGNKVIDDNIEGKLISEMTLSDAELFNGFMDEIWKGIRTLNCTRINWKKLDDWKDAQRQLLQAV
jgi:hypothetical protein